MHGKADEIKSLCQKHVWFLIVAFFPNPLPQAPCLTHRFLSMSGGSWVPSSREPMVPKLGYSGPGARARSFGEDGPVASLPLLWFCEVRTAGPVTGLIWAPVGDEMGADG